jgi:hypothetical protein
VQCSALQWTDNTLENSAEILDLWMTVGPGAPCAVSMNMACVSGVIKVVDLLTLLRNI